MTQTTRIGKQNNPALLRAADLGQPQTTQGFRIITEGFRAIIGVLGWDRAAAIAALITARYTALLAAPTRIDEALPTVNNVSNAKVGTKLSVVLPLYDGLPTPVISYQWVRGAATTIVGATGKDYVAAVADIDATLKCTITATNSQGNISETTAPTNIITA